MLLESLHHRDVSQFFVFFFCFCLNVRNKRDLTGADRSHFMGVGRTDKGGGGGCGGVWSEWQGEESGQGLA